MSENNDFPNGLFANKPSERAPDFVIANMSIIPAKFEQWLKAQKANEKGYVKLTIKESGKTGNYYAQLDTYQGRNESQQQPQQMGSSSDDQDIPF